ncbi:MULTISPECIES: DUF4190 domain-containing protein [unclassified Gordonia (in: high G+C Gram-positive bacteria)]
MRTDHPTHPIAAPVTDRHVRWPASNTLDPFPVADESAVTPPAPSVAAPAAVSAAAPAPWAARAREDAPLPEVGDYWDLDAPIAYTPPAPTRVVSRTVSVLPPRRTAPASAVALILALTSVPLILMAGVGGVLGLLSIALGAVGIRQARRDPVRYHGNGRAVVAIVLGTMSMMIGLPILMVVLLVLGA